MSRFDRAFAVVGRADRGEVSARLTADRAEGAAEEHGGAVERERIHGGVRVGVPGVQRGCAACVQRRDVVARGPDDRRERPRGVDGRSGDRERVHGCVGVGRPLGGVGGFDRGFAVVGCADRGDPVTRRGGDADLCEGPTEVDGSAGDGDGIDFVVGVRRPRGGVPCFDGAFAVVRRADRGDPFARRGTHAGRREGATDVDGGSGDRDRVDFAACVRRPRCGMAGFDGAFAVVGRADRGDPFPGRGAYADRRELPARVDGRA